MPGSASGSTRSTEIDRLLGIAPDDDARDQHSRVVDRLWLHYQEMRRWNPKLSLVGPGTAQEVVERHYAESLLGSLLLRPTDRVLVDVGTGGGFPGLVLAAARTNLETLLVEPRQRKWAFLQAAIRRMAADTERTRRVDQGSLSPPRASWSCRVVNARVGRPLPAEIGALQHVDVVSSRALAWSADIYEPFLERWPHIRFLLWVGPEAPLWIGPAPAGLSLLAEIPTGNPAGSPDDAERPGPARRIVAYGRPDPDESSPT